jgi:hypothetical protein
MRSNTRQGAVDLHPDYWLVQFAMGLALSQKRSLRSRLPASKQPFDSHLPLTLAAGFLAASYAQVGSSGKAEKFMREVMERSSKQYVFPAQVAVGIGVNWLAEFAPEIKRILRRPEGPD